MLLLWSNCIKELKFFLGRFGQLSASVRQFVLLGFATTKIFAEGFAFMFRMYPYSLNIWLFICNKSARSMPGFLA